MGRGFTGRGTCIGKSPGVDESKRIQLSWAGMEQITKNPMDTTRTQGHSARLYGSSGGLCVYHIEPGLHFHWSASLCLLYNIATSPSLECHPLGSRYFCFSLVMAILQHSEERVPCTQ
jgi:hypothetical protein